MLKRLFTPFVKRNGASFSKMRCVSCEGAGDTSVLRITEREIPKLGKDEVLIKVVSTGLNRLDILQVPFGLMSYLTYEAPWSLSSAKRSEVDLIHYNFKVLQTYWELRQQDILSIHRLYQ
eukprot:TRINITY_DN6230_c0_g1_i8.p1 TRINITY_DN6230_c0_g1~~TRINITY_DN6230_c0_g1_i8.p1  ORF type:complete len:120 (-),score=5.93 TRINITY_DN6230_c0_g1_i8:252-611(-)